MAIRFFTLAASMLTAAMPVQVMGQAMGGGTTTATPPTSSTSPGATNTTIGRSDGSRTYDDDRNAYQTLDRSQREIDAAKKGDKGKAARIVPAAPGDLTAGAAVSDRTGATLGTIEAITPEGVLLVSGATRVAVPADVFGKSRKGLLLNMTKAEFDAQAGATRP